MRIKADSTGAILACGPEVDGVDYLAALPDDFLLSFGLGKYVMLGGAITAVSGWVAPASPVIVGVDSAIF
jgi:hypothetical protein